MSDERYDEVYAQGEADVLKRESHLFQSMVEMDFWKTESPIEELFLVALVAETWDSSSVVTTLQAEIGKYRVDVLVEETGAIPHLDSVFVAVELDGHDFHEKTKEQAKRDKGRDRELLAMGYNVIRFTGSEVWADPFSCVREALKLAHSIWLKKHAGPS